MFPIEPKSKENRILRNHILHGRFEIPQIDEAVDAPVKVFGKYVGRIEKLPIECTRHGPRKFDFDQFPL